MYISTSINTYIYIYMYICMYVYVYRETLNDEDRVVARQCGERGASDGRDHEGDLKGGQERGERRPRRTYSVTEEERVPARCRSAWYFTQRRL